MENIKVTIDGVEYNLVAAPAAQAPRSLSIKRPFVVYDVNGNRVDGYKYESRARRNNDARFRGIGYWLGRADTGVFAFVSA